MTTTLYLVILFFAKVLDNTLGTAKTIFVQRNRCVLAGVALGLSNFIYLSITKNIVTSDSSLALVVVSIASGVGCCLAVALSNRFSKDRTYVNVIMSDNKEAMQEFRVLYWSRLSEGSRFSKNCSLQIQSCPWQSHCPEWSPSANSGTDQTHHYLYWSHCPEYSPLPPKRQETRYYLCFPHLFQSQL